MKHTLILIILLTVSALSIQPSKSDSPKDDSGRIINGHDVPEGKYPFVVSLQESSSPCHSKGEHFCGGSVINDNTILTAAHCLLKMDVKKVSVLVGVHHLDDHGSGSCYRAAKLVPHPEFVSGDSGDTPDIGVVKLEKAIVFEKHNKKIGKICLPQPTENAVNNKCTIMGWGQTKKDKVSQHLQEMMVTAERTSELSSKRKEMHYKIDFKESGSSACYGDSGSPLVCPVRGDMSSLAQFGVDSFVDKKTCDGITGYTNVALYNDWIKKQAED